MQKEIDLKETQVKEILAHLQRGLSITGLGALKIYGIYRLSDVIFKIRKTINVKTTMVREGKKSYAKYEIA